MGGAGQEDKSEMITGKNDTLTPSLSPSLTLLTPSFSLPPTLTLSLSLSPSPSLSPTGWTMMMKGEG